MGSLESADRQEQPARLLARIPFADWAAGAIRNLFGKKVLDEVEARHLPEEKMTMLDQNLDQLEDRDTADILSLMPDSQEARDAMVQLLASSGIDASIVTALIQGDTEALQNLPENVTTDVWNRATGLLNNLGAGQKKSRRDLDKVIHNRRGIPTIRNKEEQVGRNQLCPCGSGKKFKNCCRGKQPEEKQQATE